MSSSESLVMAAPNGLMPPKPPQRQLTKAEVKEEVKKYSFFNIKLRKQANENGDIYDKLEVAKAQRDWHVDSAPGESPYLTHVKTLAASWPQLSLLADFMEIGTSPVRWKELKKLKEQGNEDVRKERISRTNVTRLDYFESGKIDPKPFTKSSDLKDALDEPSSPTKDQRNFRLFVVEDLSRDVIEHLGGHYDIEPQFFREHIFDYTWYNTRDRWVDPPRLGIISNQQPWFQLRYTTIRYFRTAEDFIKGFDEAANFNVLRRPDDDQNSRTRWDQPEATVGLSRTRISFWMNRSHKDGPVGIMLVDPTIKEGKPMWYGYGNWEKTPSMNDKKPPTCPPRRSPYEDIIHWSQRPEAFNGTPGSKNTHIPIQSLLYFVCSEWLTMSEYIKTRLGQIEWEVSYPEHFLGKEISIDVALKKLHVWRRLVPLYREMLTETLQRVFDFPCHNVTPDIAHMASGTDLMAQTSNPPGPTPHCQCPLHNPGHGKGPIGAMREDYQRLLAYMEEYQQRIDRLTSVVTAIISIKDSRHSLQDNKNVSRLTWLATFFIPMSFVTGLFSMVGDIGELKDTIKWYFALALPLSFVSLGMAVIFTLPSVQRWLDERTKRVKALLKGGEDKKNN